MAVAKQTPRPWLSRRQVQLVVTSLRVQAEKMEDGTLVNYDLADPIKIEAEIAELRSLADSIEAQAGASSPTASKATRS